MKPSLFFALILFSPFVNAQNEIEWDGKYILQFSDFQSPATQIGSNNIHSLYSASSFDFAFYMSSLEFMMTKNFNSKVSCTFKRNAASLVAPDSIVALALLNFSRYQFDLSELYARKFRKRLFEAKGAFSDANFFRPIYDEIQKELVERHTLAAKETNLGLSDEKLMELHAAVNQEIKALPDFCKACKPPKKKK